MATTNRLRNRVSRRRARDGVLRKSYATSRPATRNGDGDYDVYGYDDDIDYDCDYPYDDEYNDYNYDVDDYDRHCGVVS